MVGNVWKKKYGFGGDAKEKKMKLDNLDHCQNESTLEHNSVSSIVSVNTNYKQLPYI